MAKVGGFNFRDIAGTAPLGILEGMVYRSSQVFTCAYSLLGMVGFAVCKDVTSRWASAACWSL